MVCQEPNTPGVKLFQSIVDFGDTAGDFRDGILTVLRNETLGLLTLR